MREGEADRRALARGAAAWKLSPPPRRIRAPPGRASRGRPLHRSAPGEPANGRDDRAAEAVPPPPRRQPIGDRDPRLPRRERARDRDGRGVRRGGQARAAPLQGGRRLSDRQGARPHRGLSLDPRDHPRGEARRRGRHPSGLRLPVGEPRIRRSLRRRGHRVHRPAAADDAHARQQGRGAQTSRSRSACR